MSNDITIYRPDGTPRMTAHIGKGSKRNFLLMESDYITLKFTTDTPTILHLGDYVDIPGAGRYELTEPYKSEQNKSTSGFDYEVKMDAQYWKFKNKLMKFLPQVGTGETAWSYTDTIEAQAGQILANIRALAYDRQADGSERLVRPSFQYNGIASPAGDWRIEWDESIDDTKAFTVSYESTNIIDAITGIAEALECEWWFEDDTLWFGKCEYGITPIDLRYGREIIDISNRDSKENYATRIYAYGSERNIPSNYRKTLYFTADQISGNTIKDSTRPIKAEWFPASMRTTSSNDRRTLSFSGGWGDEVATGSTSDTIEVRRTSATLNNIQAGSWVLKLSEYRPSVSRSVSKGSLSTGTMRITTTVRYADNTTETDTQESNFYFPHNTYVARGSFADKRYDFQKDVASLTVTAYFYVDLGRDTQAQVSITAYGSAPLTNLYPIQGATGIQLQVIDPQTGAVQRTIEGVVFNPDFEENATTLRLPSGATVAFNEKYQLPQLNSAKVPASYFTNKYAALDKYADIVTNGIVNKCLLLPETDPETGQPLHGYIDTGAFDSLEEAVEDVVVFEDCYPSRTSEVRRVVQTEPYTDEQKEQDGSTTEIKWVAFKIQDDLFDKAHPFNTEAYLIDDQDLQITFQSGLLNGMTFDVDWLDDEGMFEIQRDDTTKLPNEFIKPKIGDQYILHGFDIAMINDASTDYIAGAERRLLQKAREYAERLNTDTCTYECILGADIAYDMGATDPSDPQGLYLGLGRRVKLIHPAYFENGRISRVIGWEIALDIPYDNPTYTIGEKASYSRIGAIEDAIKEMETKGGSLSGIFGGSGNGTGGKPTYLISQIDTTPPTDRNAFSALRSLLEFARKAVAQTITAVWTFLRGLRVGNFISGTSGAAIDQNGNTEVESLVVRSFMKVYELIYNRLNAQEGNTSFADVGTIDAFTDNGDGTHTLTMRKRWDGDFTAFRPGDIIYGYVNELEGAGTHHKAWAWVQSVDRAANTLTVCPYPDADCPAGVNHALTANMVVTRWGNNIEATPTTYANPEYQGAVIVRRGDEFRNIRQTTFYISCEDGNIVELMGVHKPILDPENYGTVIGKIPDGLLDAATEELINKDQPYLFARGIIVQDLIRIDYHGVITRTANYRGAWCLDTASNAEHYYRSTKEAYDTVTHHDCLWQCLTQGTTDEPGTTGAWLCMAGSMTPATVKIWTLAPSANIISIRTNSIEPQALTCAVNLHSTAGDETFTDNVNLLNAGARLYYSLDGVNLHEFTIGTPEPLELEDGTGNVELEDSEAGELYLIVGGDDINTADIDDRIYFVLKDADTHETLTQTIIPVVKDGKDGDPGDKGDAGLPGRDGLMVYPAGYFDQATLYSATRESAPVVMYSAEGQTAPQESQQFYVLKRDKTYRGTAMNNNRNTPALDVANGGDDARWERFDKFNAIFASIIMADFAKLSSAVFFGDWMISQQGVLADGTPSSNYEGFRTGAFTPNFAVNFRTGEMNAWNGTFSGFIQTKFKTIEDSDGIDCEFSEAHDGDYRNICKKVAGDRALKVCDYDEVVLPNSNDFIGARVTICENAHAYSRNSDYAVIRTEDGSPIYGIVPEGTSGNNRGTQGSKYVRLLNGVAEFVCVPGRKMVDGELVACGEWLIASHCAAVFFGQN